MKRINDHVDWNAARGAIKFCKTKCGEAIGNRARFVVTGRCRYHDGRKAAGFLNDDICMNPGCKGARLVAKHLYWNCHERRPGERS